MFKVGDKIRRIKENHLEEGMVVGNVYTVSKILNDGISSGIYVRELKDNIVEWDPEKFELVKPKIDWSKVF